MFKFLKIFFQVGGVALWSCGGFWFLCFFCFFFHLGGSSYAIVWCVVINKFIYVCCCYILLQCIFLFYVSSSFVWLLCNKIIFLMLFYCSVVCFHRLSYVFVCSHTYFFDEIYDFSSLGFFSVLECFQQFSCFCFCQSCAFFIQSSAFF